MARNKHKIHVLTPGFTSPNGSAFLMPLILHRHVLEDAGISIEFFDRRTDETTDCDILVVDGRFHRQLWSKHSEAVLAEFADLKSRVGKLIYVDNRDSTGWDQARAFPHVTLYCKPQVLRNRRDYARSFYGCRIFADYYHNKYGVDDDEPAHSDSIVDDAQLEKLTVTWNTGLADYSWLGPYRMSLYRRLRLRPLLHFPNGYHRPSADRSIELACRIGTKYQRRTVSIQREQVAKIVGARLQTGKISRRQYLSELRDSKVALSPFGLGEITLRDFEIFLSGGLLVKPDMSHLETWPNLFEANKTMIAFDWDLNDLEQKLDSILANYSDFLEIAREGQARYRRYLCGPEAPELFAGQVSGIVAKCERLAAVV